MVMRLRDTRLKARNSSRKRDAKQERHREPDAVVAVELQFRQQITRRDAKERSGAECKRERQNRCSILRNAKPERCSADGNHQRKEEIHNVREDHGATRCAHQHRDGEAVERLVKQNHDERRQPRERTTRAVRSTRKDRGRERDTFKHAVKREPDGRADPPELRNCVSLPLSSTRAMPVRMTMRMTGTVRLAFRRMRIALL